MSIWITSDSHFGHDKPFIYEPRGFSSIKEHDEAIIKNWNSVVKPEDVVYHCGDAILGDLDYGLDCLRRLNGNIIIIWGNHDNSNRLKNYPELYNIVSVFPALRIKHKGYHFWLSHYPTITTNADDTNYTKKSTICLCGHTHTEYKYKDYKHNCYHIELDCHNNFPVSLDEVVSDIKNYKTYINTIENELEV